MDSSLERSAFWVRMAGVMKGLLSRGGHVMNLAGACLSMSVDRVDVKSWR